MLHPPRGVAASDFRPLCNIPHCCPPQGYGPCLSSIVADHPLRPATHHCLGKPLPYQLTNRPHPPPRAINLSSMFFHSIEIMRDQHRFRCYPPLQGRLGTCYALVCHVNKYVRLACVRPPASVHPEPGSNSSIKKFSRKYLCELSQASLLFLRIEYIYRILIRSSLLKVYYKMYWFVKSHCIVLFTYKLLMNQLSLSIVAPIYSPSRGYDKYHQPEWA